MTKLSHVEYEMNPQNCADGATRPPPKYANRLFHWLHSKRASNPSIAQWHKGVWHCIDRSVPLSPAEMYKLGWEWFAPVKIPKGSRIRSVT